ncbi:MAG TPA: hypothetical protein VGP88_00510 [Thermoplasmata archaeon]|jgi:hypothetical protein|nr:hypothetical protein [Thermoplasmata archaeon]
MDRADLAWLGSAILLLVFVALEPLGMFPVFGSDTGEYYNLTSVLSSTGHLPGLHAYAGWGFAYNEFPGLFELSAATAGATGVGVLSALQLVAPILAALAVVPLFLLFRRLVPNDTVAILGATLGAVFMPRMFSVAHPAPLALGDFLVIGALWMFLESRRDVRWYLPLSLTVAALLFTHHLSTYFFVVSALGLVVLTELVWPRRWSVRFPIRELGFLFVLLTGALAFWFGLGAFQSIVSAPVHGVTLSFPLVEGAVVVGFLAVAALMALRRRTLTAPQFHVRFPTDGSVLRDSAILLVGIYGGLALLVVFPLPGTMGQRTTIAALAFFAPLLLAIVGGSGSRRLLSFSRDGPLLLMWLAAVGISAILALAIGNATISPARHAEYLVLPLGLVIAVSLGRLVGLAEDRRGRPAAISVAVAIVVLVAANAAIAYPPPALFGGFQEGLTNGDATVWMWTGIAVPTGAVVASDHPVSSMVFGFDGNSATWDSTPALFTGTSWPEALAELQNSDAPHPPHDSPIDVVIIDETMRTTGVPLNPNELAAPMSANATAWFSTGPFVPVYENGGTTVYWVDFAAAPPA